MAKKPCVCRRVPKQLTHTLCKHVVTRISDRGHRTSLSKGLRSHILLKPPRLLTLRLDLLNSLIVPFLFSVRVIHPGDADGNDGGENDDAFDVSTEQFRRKWREGRLIEYTRGSGGTYGALMADFKTLRVPSTAGWMSSVCSSQPEVNHDN